LVKRYKSSKKSVQEAERKHFKPWSPDRPDKVNMDDDLAEQLFGMLEQQSRSVWSWADVSGLSTSTITHYKQRRVRRPQALSLQLLAKAMGGKIVFVKEAHKRN
jgi:hypothetical protein